jgi:fibronectin-binding autotransporter adhesin
MRGVRRSVVFVVAIAVMSLAAAAFAATGDLTPVGCIDDNTPNGPDSCGVADGTAAGMNGANSVSASADAKAVFVTSSGTEDALAIFTRTPSTGAISFASCIDDPLGADTCAQSAEGLDGASSAAASPDGKSVYVAGATDDAVVRFKRDTTTGALTPGGCVGDHTSGPAGCTKKANGLDGARSVAVSADGKSVYVASNNDQAVVRFNRNTTTGALTPAGCVDDVNGGADTCGQTVHGLGGASSINVSADGRSVYVASGTDDAVVRLDRNTTNGALTPRGCIDDNDPGQGPDSCGGTSDGMDAASAVTSSSDGKSVYVASDFDDAVVRFNRSSTGALTPKGCVDDNDTGVDACTQSTDGLDGAFGVAVSPDNHTVYVAGAQDGAIVQIARGATGFLTPTAQQCVDDTNPSQGDDTCAQSSNGMHSLQAVTVTRDGKAVLGAATLDDALVNLTREDSDPPDTRITSGPPATTTSHTATFRFVSDEPLSTFRCKRDTQAFTSCKSPKTYNNLAKGTHVFKVKAIDPSGNVDLTPAKRTWTIS